MSVLSYKNKVNFDSFMVETIAEGLEPLTESSAAQKISKSKYYGASAYMCADCIKKYSMLKEAGIKSESELPEADPDDFDCCVEGCSNVGSLDVWLRPENCEIV